MTKNKKPVDDGARELVAKQAEDEGFMTIAAAASFLATGRSTVYDLIADEKLPSFKPQGSKRLLPRAAVKAYARKIVEDALAAKPEGEGET